MTYSFFWGGGVFVCLFLSFFLSFFLFLLLLFVITLDHTLTEKKESNGTRNEKLTNAEKYPNVSMPETPRSQGGPALPRRFAPLFLENTCSGKNKIEMSLNRNSSSLDVGCMERNILETQHWGDCILPTYQIRSWGTLACCWCGKQPCSIHINVGVCTAWRRRQ